MEHMGLHADYITVPQRATTLLDDAAALWARMAPAERAAHYPSTPIVPDGRVAQRSCAALHPVIHTRHGRNALTPTFS